jgi:hypothetical protein
MRQTPAPFAWSGSSSGFNGEELTVGDITPKPIEIPPDPIDVALEPKGTPLVIKGVIESFWQGTAIVAVPNGGGGTTGVWTAIEKGNVGDPAEVNAVVDTASRDSIAVTIATFGQEEQAVDLARFKAFPDTKATTTATEGAIP